MANVVEQVHCGVTGFCRTHVVFLDVPSGLEGELKLWMVLRVWRKDAETSLPPPEGDFVLDILYVAVVFLASTLLGFHLISDGGRRTSGGGVGSVRHVAMACAGYW